MQTRNYAKSMFIKQTNEQTLVPRGLDVSSKKSIIQKSKETNKPPQEKLH